MMIEWETKTYDTEIRYALRCDACRAASSAVERATVTVTRRSDMIREAARSVVVTVALPTSCRCGGSLSARRVNGVRNETPCGPKCHNSKGHVCECSCGGKNHGAGLAA